MVPYNKDDVASLLKACDVSRSWKTRESTTNTRPSANRDRAIILTLLDTGMRASELCGIHYADINFSNNSIEVSGKGPRGGKKRTVYFGKRVAQSLWKYLQPRLETLRPDDEVFTMVKGVYENHMTRDRLLKLLKRIGDRASVADVHPHRFRHTFAINYLRNGGDLFTLQALLGHEDLTMVKRYARIAQNDCEDTHRKASPVDNWKL